MGNMVIEDRETLQKKSKKTNINLVFMENMAPYLMQTATRFVPMP